MDCPPPYCGFGETARFVYAEVAAWLLERQPALVGCGFWLGRHDEEKSERRDGAEH
jgi:hypothetical protein